MRLNRLALNAALTLVFATGAADATPPDAWVEYEKEVSAACIGASGLNDAKPAGKLIDFDDRLGVSAIVIQGRYPQKHMNDTRARMLCFFDKKTRTPFVSEARDLLR